ncbi:hypothetical protein AMTR_s00046p00211220 [Amborella trichopoda]|uniref:Uncharacterized protein n=1 Tax=Amborella trichopoda TaxID=13333 RepID=U5D6K1_AMBTC|nr:hypothetical protein AMTR_s00046p00211220 [Amborella trichopoda]
MKLSKDSMGEVIIAKTWARHGQMGMSSRRENEKKSHDCPKRQSQEEEAKKRVLRPTENKTRPPKRFCLSPDHGLQVDPFDSRRKLYAQKMVTCRCMVVISNHGVKGLSVSRSPKMRANSSKIRVASPVGRKKELVS